MKLFYSNENIAHSDACKIIVIRNTDKQLISTYAKNAIRLEQELDKLMATMDPVGKLYANVKHTLNNAVKQFTDKLSKYTAILLIHQNEDVIGLAYIKQDKSEEEFVHLSKIVIDQRYRSMGYGRRFITDVENLLTTVYPKSKILLIGVSTANTSAIDLYESIGCKPRYMIMYKHISNNR
jgi:ribosomal protein S18 acetylase RimI-like enzyme